MTTRREHIIARVSDLVADFLYYDRQEDEDLPSGAIQDAIKAGEISKAEIVAEFESLLKV